MSSVYNLNLKSIASKTAVQHSLVPVIICDSNLRVCMINTGAAQYFGNMRIGTDFSVYIPHKADISDGSYINMSINNSSFSALIAVGCVQNQDYIAFIFENTLMKVPADLEYIDRAQNELISTLKELMNDQHAAKHRLSSRFHQLEHLKNCAHLANNYHFSRSTLNIENTVDYILSQCEDQLELIGCTAKKNINTEGCVSIVYCEKYIHMIITILMAAGIAISKNGQLEIFCRKAPNSNNINDVEFGIAVNCTDSCSDKIHSLSDLIDNEPLVAMELAAVDYMLSVIPQTLKLTYENDIARIYFVIQAKTAEVVNLNSTSAETDNFVQMVFANLCRILNLTNA